MVFNAKYRHFLWELDATRVAAIIAAIFLNVALFVALTIPSTSGVGISGFTSDQAEPLRAAVTIPYTPAAGPFASDKDDYLHWVWLPFIQHPHGCECGGGYPPRPLSTTPMEITAPAPDYPADAFREGVTGDVMLKLLIDVHGNVRSATVEFSSGDRRLDRAARDQALRHWRFSPALRKGVPVEAITRVPVEFRL